MKDQEITVETKKVNAGHVSEETVKKYIENQKNT